MSGCVFAAVITGIFHRMFRENDAAHGEAIAKSDEIATTVHEIDDQLDDMAVWQEKHQKLHAGRLEHPDEGLDRSGPLYR